MLGNVQARRIVLYWALLLVPAAAITAGAFRLLRGERDRLAERSRAALADRAQAIADGLQLTVAAVEDGLSDELRRVPPDNAVETLAGWSRENPLVRNVFVWRPGAGVLYPDPARPSTDEERRFLARYDALFAGRIGWDTAREDNIGPEAPGGPDPARPSLHEGAPQSSAFAAQVRNLQTTRQQLVDLARNNPAAPPRPLSAGRPPAAGWIPWFTDNRLHLLGWQRNADGLMVGVEIEFAALLSRLIVTLPNLPPNDAVFALLDGGGRIVHQSAPAELSDRIRPQVDVPLAPALPHWRIAAYRAAGNAPADPARGFMVLSTLLLVIFIAAIVLGGGLLTWQAHRSSIDARQKTSFVSNVSHELKTPLTSIRMYAELIGQGRVADEDRRRRYLQVIAQESERLTRLVNNVLDFSRLEQGRKTYRIEDLSAGDLVRHVAEANRLRIQEAGMRLDVSVPDMEIRVRADRDALQQALLNLVDNAAKYASEGGRLEVVLAARDGRAEVRVLDRGPGIPPAHRKRVFEKFHRVDESLAARQQGTGLGLSIARGLLRDMGGDVRYEPREGGGCCFTLLIPRTGEGTRT